MTQFSDYNPVKAALDDAVRTTRSKPQPAAVLNMRKTPRMSIDELNATDVDTLREKFLTARRDDRGPVESFLDLLDAPRQAIFTSLAPSLEAKARAEGNTGAFGVGRVHAADVLGNMGLKPGVLRGVLGFVGDVAFDPLTYLGPPGWGARVTTAGGKGLRFGKGLNKALAAGDAAGPEIAALAKAAGNPANLREAALGGVQAGKTKLGRVGNSLHRLLGGDTEYAGGLLSKYGSEVASTLDDPTEQALKQAVQGVIGKYGAAARPGIRIGKNATSAIAHIPFTDIGLFVPAFTAPAKTALQAHTLAEAARGKVFDPAQSIKTAAVDAAHADADGTFAAANALADEQRAFDADRHLMDPDHAAFQAADFDSRRADLLSKMKEQVDHIAKVSQEAETGGARDPLSVLAMRKKAQGYQAKMLSAVSKIRDGNDLKALRSKVSVPGWESSLQDFEVEAAHRAFQASTHASLSTNQSALSFLDNAQAEILKAQKQFMGTEDDIVGASGMTPLITIAKAIFKNDDHAALSVVRGISDKMRSLFGGDGGLMQDAARHYLFMAGEGAKRQVNESLYKMQRELGSIAAAHGLGHQEDQLASLAFAVAHRDAGLDAFHTHDLEGNAGGMFKHLQDAINDGLYSDKAHPGIVKDIDAWAAKWKKDLVDSRITPQEMSAGILNEASLREGYLGSTLTPQGRRYVKRANVSNPAMEGGVGSGGRLQAIESFEKPRTTDSARFESKITGKMEEVFNADRFYQSKSDAELEAITSPGKLEAAKLRKQLIDEYDALGPDAPPMKMNDPMMVNQLIKKGKFNTLMGANEVPGGFFDTNMATHLLSRLLSHERAMAREGWKDVRDATALWINTDAEGGLAKKINNVGDIIELGHGAKGKVVRLSSGGHGIKVGDDVFRALHPDIRNKLQPSALAELMGKQHLSALYHENVASLIEGVHKLEQSQDFWNALDKITAAWKTANLFHPSWTIGNLIGDFMNIAVQDPHAIVAAIKYLAQAPRMIRYANDPEKLKNILLDINGTTTSGHEVMQAIHGSPVVDASVFAEPGLGVRGGTVNPSRLGPVSESFNRQMLKSDFKTMYDYQTIGEGVGDTRAKAAAGFGIASDRLHRWLLEPWRIANQKVSDTVRLVGYLSLRDQGVDHANAVRRLVRSAFDYQNMTEFERKYMRRLFPFYSWLKNNSVYQAKMLMERPIYAGAFPSLQRAVEEAINGEEPIPISARPKWMREQLAIQLGTDPEQRSALLVGSWMPTEQALWWGRATDGLAGVQNAIETAASSLNPIARVPLEMAFGKQLGTGRTVGPTTDEADVSLAGEVLGQIRPLREAQKITKTVSEQGALQGVARLLAGGRSQSFSDKRIETSKSREFADEESRLRNSIRTAEFKQDKAASLRLRVKLLKLYEAKKRAGGKVPKWAEKTLSQITTQ